MKRNYILLVLLCFSIISIQSFAQSTNGIIKRADKLYNQFNFQKALTLYQKADEKNPENIYVKGKIGNCYRFLNRIKDSEPWYAAAANAEGSENIFKFRYAQTLMSNGKYDDALEAYNSYYEAEGKNDLKETGFQENIFTENVNYTIKIEDFNSTSADFAPIRIRDVLYFVSNRPNESFTKMEDVWTSKPFTQIYSKNVSDSAKNNKVTLYNRSVSKMFHEGPMGWDKSKNDLYITRSNYLNKKPSVDENKAVNLKIFKLAYVPEENDFGSILVDNLAFSDKNFNIAYPTISPDGKFMIFASDMPGGYGGLDLYVAQDIGGIWSNPTNLGSKINTPGNDAFPFLMSDGVLYFSSDGHLGLGGYDIYTSEIMEDGTFDKVTNIRSPINSPYDDFGFWMNEEFSAGYYTSNRPSAYGDDDIYSFTKKGFTLSALIFDSETEEMIEDAKVTLTNLDTKEEIVLLSDNLGSISNTIVPFSKYKLKIEKEDYLPEELEFSTIDDNVTAKIPLIKDGGILLEITVVDMETGKEIPNADVQLIELLSAETEAKVANEYGKVAFVLQKDTKYRLTAGKVINEDVRYLAVSKDFNTFEVESPANLYTTIELRKIEKRVPIKIDNIYYDLGKYFIRDDAKPELDKLVKILKDNPSIDIELSSHTDCRATKKYNAKLSANRAEAAINYLITNGISYRRLTATGYGETKLTNGCACEGSVKSTCTEEQHQANRRTEFTVLRFKQ